MQELEEQVPQEAITWGGIGLVPYIGTSATTVYLATRAGAAERTVEIAGGGMLLSVETPSHLD
jgi:hypothetical protein